MTLLTVKEDKKIKIHDFCEYTNAVSSIEWEMKNIKSAVVAASSKSNLIYETTREKCVFFTQLITNDKSTQGILMLYIPFRNDKNKKGGTRRGILEWWALLCVF